MGIFDPTPTPYDPLDWEKKPFAEKAQMVCTAIATQGYGVPNAVYILYALKIWLYVGMWSFFCGFTPGIGGLADLGSWWAHPIAFQKAIVWSMFFEVFGLGCSCGPLSGKYQPPIPTYLHFLRPGTTKIPFFDNLPLLGNTKRTPLDAMLYAGLLVFLVLALIHPEPGPPQYIPIVAILFVLGFLDVTVFLAARAEHFWTMLVCFAFAPNWIPAAMAVQLALWFWAGVSKLNGFFPSVVTFMMSNSPLTPWTGFRKMLYRNYPSDLRPSALPVWLAHGGAALELAVPTVLLTAAITGNPTVLMVGLVLVVFLHTFIVFNIPMGAPLEWNLAMIYGGVFFFAANTGTSPLMIESIPILIFLFVMIVAIPLVGNLKPHLVSFLLSMRYYAGNWAYSVWFFKKDAHMRLENLKKASPWIMEQLEASLDPAVAVGAFGRGMGFRLMHLQGRAVHDLIPVTLDNPRDYLWVDGEVIAGLALGWNFGDAHLHQGRLLSRIQEQCGFEEGEVRCLFFESQPLLGNSLAYEIHDACTGLMQKGEIFVAELKERQPWPTAKTSA